jgi:beta-lactamase regulating signal transducer with metallopeptidase domain
MAGRQNSGTRFAIWFSALLAIVALPFFGGAGVQVFHFPALAPARSHEQIILSPVVAFCLFAAWGAGAGVLLLRLTIGMWRVHQFRRNCSEVDLATLDPAIAAVVSDFGSRQQIKLCVSSEATVPAAVGFFRPAIVFPAWLLPQLSAGEVEIILLHEFAHLRRRDDWTNLTQKIVRAVFFFHPAVWWIESRLTLEREMACDDIVLAQTASPRAYASSLISFAEKLQGARGLALVQALVSRMHQMSLRVAQILDAKRPHRAGLWKPVLGLSAGMVAVALGAAPYMPRVVAFRAQPSESPTRQTQAAQNAPGTPQPAATVRPVTELAAAHRRLARQAKVIPAAFHPRTDVSPLKLKRPSRMPVLKNVNTTLEEPPMPEAIFIVRTAQYDASGSGVWTLCIWRVRGNNPAERKLESAIIVRLI